MHSVLIVSQKFNYGHISGLKAWQTMFKSLGYVVYNYYDEQYYSHIHDGYRTNNNSEVLRDINVVIIFNISTRDNHFITKLKSVNPLAKIVFIYHEPWRGLKKELDRYANDKKNLIKQILRKAFAYNVIKNSDLIICPSPAAAKYYKMNEARINPNYKEFPLVFYDDCGGNYRNDKHCFSFISTALPDKALDCYFEFVKYAYDKDDSIRFNVVTSSKIDCYIDDIIRALVLKGIISIQQGHGLSEAEMNSAYDDSICTWLVYRTSTQSGVLPKAFMWGSPCIATHVGVFDEIIDGTNGILVSGVNSFKEIYDAYQTIKDNKLVFQSNARRTFECRYDASHRAFELKQLISSLYIN